MTSEPERLRDLLGEVGGKFGLGSANEVGKIWARWAEIVGPGIADHADPTSLRRGVLRVRADSPAWATELGYLADELRTRVNEAVSTDLVGEVRVWIGPRGDRPREQGSERRQRASAAPGKGRTEDPREALERAREAWFKAGAGGPGRSSRRGAENQEKRR